MFTKQHYEKIAEILASEQGSSMVNVIVYNITSKLAEMFMEDNPNFDREKFFKAAGFNS